MESPIEMATNNRNAIKPGGVHHTGNARSDQQDVVMWGEVLRSSPSNGHGQPHLRLGRSRGSEMFKGEHDGQRGVDKGCGYVGDGLQEI